MSISNYQMEIDNLVFGQKDAEKMTYNGSNGVGGVKNLPDVHMDKTKNQIGVESARQEGAKIEHQLLRRKDALMETNEESSGVVLPQFHQRLCIDHQLHFLLL